MWKVYQKVVGNKLNEVHFDLYKKHPISSPNLFINQTLAELDFLTRLKKINNFDGKLFPHKSTNILKNLTQKRDMRGKTFFFYYSRR